MISEIIKDIRKSNNLSQDKFANIIGVTQQVVAKWENNKCQPNATSIIAICKKFNITPNELLEFE